MNLLQRLQSVMIPDTKRIFSSLSFVTSAQPTSLAEGFEVTVLARKCQHGLAPTYLCDKLRPPADTEAREWLCFATSTSLAVWHTRLSIVNDRAFPVVATRLEQSSITRRGCPPLCVFCCCLKITSLLTFWSRILTFLSICTLYSARIVTWHFGHYTVSVKKVYSCFNVTLTNLDTVSLFLTRNILRSHFTKKLECVGKPSLMAARVGAIITTNTHVTPQSWVLYWYDLKLISAASSRNCA